MDKERVHFIVGIRETPPLRKGVRKEGFRYCILFGDGCTHAAWRRVSALIENDAKDILGVFSCLNGRFIQFYCRRPTNLGYDTFPRADHQHREGGVSSCDNLD